MAHRGSGRLLGKRAGETTHAGAAGDAVAHLIRALTVVVVTLLLVAGALIAIGKDLQPYFGLLAQLERVWYALGGAGGLVAAYRVLRDRPINANAEVAAVGAKDDTEQLRRELAAVMEGLRRAGLDVPTEAPISPSPPSRTGPQPVVAAPTPDPVPDELPVFTEPAAPAPRPQAPPFGAALAEHQAWTAAAAASIPQATSLPDPRPSTGAVAAAQSQWADIVAGERRRDRRR